MGRMAEEWFFHCIACEHLLVTSWQKRLRVNQCGFCILQEPVVMRSRERSVSLVIDGSTCVSSEVTGR